MNSLPRNTSFKQICVPHSMCGPLRHSWPLLATNPRKPRITFVQQPADGTLAGEMTTSSSSVFCGHVILFRSHTRWFNCGNGVSAGYTGPQERDLKRITKTRREGKRGHVNSKGNDIARSEAQEYTEEEAYGGEKIKCMWN